MTDLQSEETINLDADTSVELKRIVVSQTEVSLEDSTVIPRIEDLLQGRCKTSNREMLKFRFDEGDFKV